MTIYDTAWWQANPQHMPEQRNGTRAWAYELQEQAIADVLRPLAVNSVLEVGCGYGRVTKVIADALLPARYVATDTSEGQIELAREHVGERGVTFETLDIGVFNREPADLVVASEVLMHRPPSQVIYDVALIAQHAKRYILTVDWHEDGDRKAEGCYRHDYAALFGKYGFVTEVPLPKIRQAIFLTAMPTTDRQRDHFANGGHGG